MGIFNNLFGGKKSGCCNMEIVEEPKKKKGCCCDMQIIEEPSCCCCGSDETSTAEPCCEAAADGICCIKVLGAGCKSCHEQYEYVKEAVKNMGLSVEVEYITDLEKVMAYGAMSMPAIVVNDKVVSMGKILKAADVEKLLNKLGI